eukprot:2569889-Amphidinium_carterae.1
MALALQQHSTRCLANTMPSDANDSPRPTEIEALFEFTFTPAKKPYPTSLIACRYDWHHCKELGTRASDGRGEGAQASSHSIAAGGHRSEIISAMDLRIDVALQV